MEGCITTKLKIGLSFGIILLFILSAVAPISQGYNVNISDNIEQYSIPSSKGNILYVGGSGEGNYTKIQDAIDNSYDGDTVFVFDDSSPYYEMLIINKSIKLIGEHMNTTVIDGNKKDISITILNDDVTLSCLTIANNRRGDVGIYILSNNNTIIDIIVKNNSYYGILLEGSSYNYISGNRILDSSGGIYLRSNDGKNSCNNSITCNNITNNLGKHGICLAHYNVGNIISDNNIVFSGGNGILLSSHVKSNIITQNIVCNNNGVGIQAFMHSSNNIISDNIIENNEDDGILLLDYCDNNFVSGNVVKNNNLDGRFEGGIALFRSRNNIIIENTVSENKDAGIYLYKSNYNIFYHNNILKNSDNIYCEGDTENTWDNGYPSGGNFWDDYNGIDDDGDGIGDTPYPIHGGDNEDRYPLMYPTINVPPDTPKIKGLFRGKPNVEYEFTFKAKDLNDDAIMYIIDWGDGNIEWTAYSDSGVEFILKHAWEEYGRYSIKAKAIDIHGTESDWGKLQVNMPRNKAVTNPMLLRILERFPLLWRVVSRLNAR